MDDSVKTDAGHEPTGDVHAHALAADSLAAFRERFSPPELPGTIDLDDASSASAGR